jgi:hypothetical protein
MVVCQPPAKTAEAANKELLITDHRQPTTNCQLILRVVVAFVVVSDFKQAGHARITR